MATPNFTGMTDDEIDAMPIDDFSAAIYAEMKGAPALLTCDEMDQIEALWESDRQNRRCALILLTKPWDWLSQKVIEDREFAVTVEQCRILAEGAELYKNLAHLMEAVKVRALIALASRDDMSDIQAEAEATLGD